MWSGLVCVKKIILPVISIQKKFGMAGIKLLIVLKPWWFNEEKIAIQASIDQKTTKLIRVEDLCEIERINLIKSLGVSHIAISYIVSSTYLSGNKLSFCLIVFLFFFGCCCCCCLLHFKNKCKRNIDLDVDKQVEKSKPWSISIFARDYDYNLLLLANHTPPFSYTVLLTPCHMMKQLFSNTSSQDSVKESKRNSSPISVVAKVLYSYLQFFKLKHYIESFWRQLFQFIIGQVTKKENMT